MRPGGVGGARAVLPSGRRGAALLAAVVVSLSGAVTVPPFRPTAEALPVPSDSLRLTLSTPDEVESGERVPMVLRAENVAGRTLELYLRGRTIAFDIVVEDEAGGQVWRRLEGEIVPAILRIEPLAPDDTLTLTHTWDQRGDDGRPVGPGLYTVRARLLTEEDPISFPPAALRVREGRRLGAREPPTQGG